MKQGDNEIDVFGELPWFDADVVRKARVLVAGAGALGNEVLKNLALFGMDTSSSLTPTSLKKATYRVLYSSGSPMPKKVCRKWKPPQR